jgi:aminoglycoside phosphotransferase (APT) family kinase protein
MRSRRPERSSSRGPGARSAPGPADCQEADTAAEGLEAFRRRRRAVFYPKADDPETAGLMKLAQGGDGAEEAERRRHVAAACRETFGWERVSVAPLGEQGTFHRLYRATPAGGGAVVVVRVNALSHLGHDYPLHLDAWAAEKLRGAGLPALRVHRVDLSRRVCPFDYQILEQARGVSLRSLDDDDESLRPLLFRLGRLLARLHRLPLHGFGLMDVGPLVTGGAAADCGGLLSSWADYVRLNLEEHVRDCADGGAIDGELARQVLDAFARHAGVFERIEAGALLHGDPGSHNVFADAGEIAALIDWEDCLAGDPVYEVAFWATFHPERRHGAFLDGYRSEWPLPDDFGPRFWLYFLRVALCKTVLRQRLGIVDKPGRPPASERIRKGLAGLEGLRRAA